MIKNYEVYGQILWKIGKCKKKPDKKWIIKNTGINPGNIETINWNETMQGWIITLKYFGIP